MNQIKAGAILNYVIIFLNIFVGVFYTPYMLRCLGQNEYGVYSLIASIIAYLTILDFGFGNAIVRYTAKFRAEGKKQEQWDMFGMFLMVYSAIGIIAFIGGMCLYLNVDSLFDRTMSNYDLMQAKTMMIFLTINLALTFPLSIFGSIVTAYENFIFQRVVNIIRIVLSTIIMLIILALGYKAVALVAITTIFNLSTLIINYVYCKKSIRIKVCFKKINWHFLKEIAAYSFWIFLNAIVEKIYWGTGQFVLGSIVGPVAVAIFSVAILLQQFYLQFSAAIASVLLPKITSMVVNGYENRELSQIFIQTGRLQSLILTLIICGFVVFGQSFINIWAGKEYAQSFHVTLIFFFSLYIPLIQNTAVTILQARNQLKFRSICYVFISLFSLGLQIYLSKRFGLLGCAYSIGVALIIGQGIIMNIYYEKIQHLQISEFWKQISLSVLAPTIFTVLWIILPIPDIYRLPQLLFQVAIFVSLYFCIIYKFSINEWEKQLFRQCFTLIKRKI